MGLTNYLSWNDLLRVKLTSISLSKTIKHSIVGYVEIVQVKSVDKTVIFDKDCDKDFVKLFVKDLKKYFWIAFHYTNMIFTFDSILKKEHI